MMTAEQTIERLAQVGGLEELPAAAAAIQQAQKDLAALDEQRGRLLPNVIATEREAIRTRAAEQIREAYDREREARLKSLESERGRALVETAGVEMMPQSGAQRRALEAQWVAEVPAFLAALPHISDVAELQEVADIAFVRQSSALIRTLVPAVLNRLQALEAEQPHLALQGRFADWRRANATYRRRTEAIEGKEYAITSGLNRSRDVLLEVHGFKQAWQ
jgi:hypothetical protein